MKHDGDFSDGIVFEPLGKTLLMLMDETREDGGLSNEIIKRVAKDILSALKILHDDCKYLHSDIKPANIAACTSQRNLLDQINDIIDSRKSLEPFRMSTKQNTEFNEKKQRSRLQKFISEVDVPELENPLTFKLIDFGNAMVSRSGVK